MDRRHLHGALPCRQFGGEKKIQGTGYVVRSLEAALWAFHHSHDFRSGCLMAVNLGDDADTSGAIYGQIAGAYYGANGIPSAWREKLAKRTVLIDFAMELFDLSTRRAEE